jgi:hypothetical protein
MHLCSTFLTLFFKFVSPQRAPEVRAPEPEPPSYPASRLGAVWKGEKAHPRVRPRGAK